MKQALDEHEIAVEYYEETPETVYLGYETHLSDSTKLFGELKTIVAVAVERDVEAAVESSLFHTEYPVIGRWQIEADWLEERRDESMTQTELVARTLQTVDTVTFQ